MSDFNPLSANELILTHGKIPKALPQGKWCLNTVWVQKLEGDGTIKILALRGLVSSLNSCVVNNVYIQCRNYQAGQGGLGPPKKPFFKNSCQIGNLIFFIIKNQYNL